jgi:hypothetical protein
MQQAGARFDAAAWRLWGRVGAALSLCFYLLEYAPGHVGMRLEVNHPLHALAWLCGGEVIADVIERWHHPAEKNWRGLARLALAVAGVLAVPVAIRIGGPMVFAMSDPFMSGLHERIGEFQSPLGGVGVRALTALGGMVDPVWAALLAGIVLAWIRRDRGDVVLWFTMMATLLFTALGLW